MDIEERVKINKLVKVYGEFLTPRQREIISMYVDNNLSLAEVSDELSITRQAVKDALDKSIESLDALEKKVGAVEKEQKILNILNSGNDLGAIKAEILAILEE